jgi:hypothetical protein
MKSSFLQRNVQQHQRNVVAWRAAPPSRDSIKNPLFHFVPRQGCRLTDNFPNAFDAKHFSPRIKNFRDAVGVQNDAVTRLELQFQARRSIDCVRQRAEDCAPRFKQQRALPAAHQHCRRMPGTGKDHSA